MIKTAYIWLYREYTQQTIMRKLVWDSLEKLIFVIQLTDARILENCI